MKRRSLVERLLNATRDTPLSDFILAKCICVQSLARHLASHAKRLGVLIPEPCAHCGTQSPIIMHHHDYFLPLAITWLCDPCHRAEHSRLYRAGILLPGQDEPRRRVKPAPEPDLEGAAA